MRRLVLGIAGVVLLGSAALVGCRHGASPTAAPAPSSSADEEIALAHGSPVAHAAEPPAEASPALAGLDLTHVALADGSATAPVDAGTAKLTLDPVLQHEALGLMQAHHLPEAAIVLMDTATGKLLVYASHVDKGAARDLCTEATAPSASVFKIVTAAALVEDAHLGADTRQCYSGGEQRIMPVDLVDDPQRDKWCVTLAGALGRSINTVFARLAKEHLSPAQLEGMASRFGYGDAIDFDAPVQPGALHIPSEPLEFARTAAGFWNTTLSPVQAAAMSALVAREGETVRPSIVDQIVAPTGAIVWSAPEPRPGRHVIMRDTAAAIEAMMERTVAEGTSFKAFHDGKGGTFLPGIVVAGKTGTLTEAESQRYYTWFTGFAPAHRDPSMRQVAVAALVVNGPEWQVKANVIARDVLRAYFAEQGVAGVTRPSTREVARRHKK